MWQGGFGRSRSALVCVRESHSVRLKSRAEFATGHLFFAGAENIAFILLEFSVCGKVKFIRCDSDVNILSPIHLFL